MNWAYMLRCADGSLYAGWTNNLPKRLEAHNGGTAAKYTRSRRPVSLVLAEEYDTRKEAMGREAALKKMNKRQKEELVRLYQQKHEG